MSDTDSAEAERLAKLEEAKKNLEELKRKKNKNKNKKKRKESAETDAGVEAGAVGTEDPVATDLGDTKAELAPELAPETATPVGDSITQDNVPESTADEASAVGAQEGPGSATVAAEHAVTDESEAPAPSVTQAEDQAEKQPGERSEEQPEKLPVEQPEEKSEELPEKLPEKLPEEQPEELPGEQPEEQPEELPEELPQAQTEEQPIEQPQEQPEVQPEEQTPSQPPTQSRSSEDVASLKARIVELEAEVTSLRLENARLKSSAEDKDSDDDLLSSVQPKPNSHRLNVPRQRRRNSSFVEVDLYGEAAKISDIRKQMEQWKGWQIDMRGWRSLGIGPEFDI